MKRLIYLPSLFVLIALSVIAPNAAKEVAALSLLLLSLAYLVERGFSVLAHKYFFFYYLGAVVTLFYVLVGLFNGAPEESVVQVAIVYIITPLLWGVVLVSLVREYGLDRIVLALVLCLFFAILSQAYYYFAFLNFGPHAVMFLVDSPNVNLVEDGHSAAVMHVFGSMIFLVGGLFAAPESIKSKLARVFMIAFALIAVLTSGRDALVLAVLIGVFLFLLHAIMRNDSKWRRLKRFGNLVLILVIFCLLLLAFSNLFGQNLMLSVEGLFEKIANKGGDGRKDQLTYFVDSIASHYFLGAGHGVGLSYKASDMFPWRYEMIWVATLHRVGIFGAIIYALPFMIVAVSGFRLLIKGRLGPSERFLFGGFVCAFVATNTNPYIEGFVFQWMYVLPITYYLSLLKLNIDICDLRNSNANHCYR